MSKNNKRREMRGNDPFTLSMYSGTMGVSMDSQSSKVFSPMVNKKWNAKLNKASAEGDWSELIAEAEKSRTAFRNRFYA